MREQLIQLETAKLAKEKGFDEPSFYYAHLYFGREIPLTKKNDYHAIKLVNSQIKKFITTTDNKDDTRDFERNGLSSNDTLYITPENYINYIKNWLNESFLALPTQSLLQKWLRETHNIHVTILPELDEDTNLEFFNLFILPGIFSIDDFFDFKEDKNYKSYEEALEKGLFEGLKLIT
jgi:hypothetical protein